MAGKQPYHSALSAFAVTEGDEIDRFELGGSVAMAHDIMRGLPPEFDKCDVFFMEPPWRSGFEVFNARAGVADQRAYPDFMAAVGRIIESIRRPAYVIIGKADLKLLPRPAATYQLRAIDGGQYVCAIYNEKVPCVAPSEMSLLAMLAHRHECVGDFLCGYGKAAVLFHAAGKRFVASDYVRHCIGVLKRRLAA